MKAIVLAMSVAFAPQADTAYFQQGIDYRIEARLDEDTDVLSGRARVRYVNNSTQRIDTLWFHMHLNAFRPNSAWATRDLEFDNRRFTDLGPGEHAFERLKTVEIGGTAISPVFPGAPDSTVVGFPLPRPLAPGDSTVVRFDWDARLSTLPRRQGRRDRHFDFAQWYPRIATFDRGGWQVQPLMPQGEFYGEFATYDVTLDVPADQVMGATGVPVDGDPGWAGAKAAGSPDPLYRRDAFGSPAPENLGLLDGEPDGGRKRVRWRAEDVHHFAWTTNPAYIYEGGEWEDVAIHVLYQPGDTAWDDGVVVRRTAAALAFFDTIFGDFSWPQITNVHRIEGGGTEFPMMVMDGSASEGLIVHEVAHNYVHGILANNEWREGWLDEGFASFLSNWYWEEKGNDPAQLWGNALESIRELERTGATEPIGLASADFKDFGTYNAMTYTKPSLVLRSLRWLIGEDDFRAGMREYFEDNELRHVRETDFIAAMEEAAGEELDWFFQQYIHTTGTLDYAVGAVSTERAADGRWNTRVEIRRTGDIWMPVEVRAGDVTQRASGRERTQTVTITTPARPTEVALDPDQMLIETDVANNRKPAN